MGTMFLVFAMNTLLLVLYLPFRLCGRWSKLGKVLAKKIHRVMFFRWQLVLILEAYLDLSLAVCINLYKFKGTWTTWDNILNNVLVIVIGI